MWWPQSDAIVAVKHICAETHASNHMTDDLCVSMMLFTSCLAFTHLTCMDAHARGCVGGCGIQSCMGTSTLCNCGCSCCASTHSHLHSQRAPRLNMHRGIACPHDGMHAPKLACACIDVYMHVHALRAATDIETLMHTKTHSKSIVMEQVGGRTDRHISYPRAQASCTRIVTQASATAWP